ncbi:hypothetical protein Pcinc_042037, partial [Petrolisthes cinctipes]
MWSCRAPGPVGGRQRGLENLHQVKIRFIEIYEAGVWARILGQAHGSPPARPCCPTNSTCLPASPTPA